MNQSPNQSNQRPFLNQVTVQSRIRIRIGIGICGGANGQFVYLARGNRDRNRALRRPRFGINWRPASTVPRPRTFASACPTRSKDPAVSRTRCHTTNQGQMITSLSASLSINAEGGKVGRWEGEGGGLGFQCAVPGAAGRWRGRRATATNNPNKQKKNVVIRSGRSSQKNLKMKMQEEEVERRWK